MGLNKTDYSASISSTEYFFGAGSTTAGTGLTTDCYGEWTIVISGILAAGDRYEFVAYETVNGVRSPYARVEIDGARTNHVSIPARILTDGYDLSAKKLAGTDRTLKATFRSVT